MRVLNTWDFLAGSIPTTSAVRVASDMVAAAATQGGRRNIHVVIIECVDEKENITLREALLEMIPPPTNSAFAEGTRVLITDGPPDGKTATLRREYENRNGWLATLDADGGAVELRKGSYELIEE